MNAIANKSDVNLIKGSLKTYVYQGDSGMLCHSSFPSSQDSAFLPALPSVPGNAQKSPPDHLLLPLLEPVINSPNFFL